MKSKFLAIMIIVLVCFGGFFIYRVEPSRLQVSMPFQIYVPPDNLHYNGTCSVNSDNINFSIPKNPDLSKDTVTFAKQVSYETMNRKTPVDFKLILYLNGTEKLVEIGQFTKVDYYQGVVTCNIDGIQRAANYNLTITSEVNGLANEDNPVQLTFKVP